ncbi:peroxidase family protein [Haloglycomyces albus]|uniref:peroxidase family protein n=1 Tax=Haloglycomyces albus TaxID=526067 RepID=UPI00046C9795|nr:peroxidase family protein [Haloglycomyces albus]
MVLDPENTDRRSGRSTKKEWHEKPFPLATLALARLRERMRRDNLHDTYVLGGEATRRAVRDGELPWHRSYDGSGYDADDVDMGRAWTRFDRNQALEEIGSPYADLDPSPREVSRSLLNRESFQPAEIVNLFAAAWIQFQNHDWFFHGESPKEHPIEVPLESDDPWPDRPMCVRRTMPDPTATHHAKGPDTYVNTRTHWWDGSQIYGSSREHNARMRTGEHGKMIVDDYGRLPLETNPELPGVDLTGMNENYWAGLALLHTMFVKEHNAVCDMLRRHYRAWSDERLFQTARLVTTALMAKIHTVEWTPAILPHPVLQFGMNCNWYGALGKTVRTKLGRVSKNEALSGILGSPSDHHAAPYSITEEFVTCYRLHPLIPDEFSIRSFRNDAPIATVDFMPLQGNGTRTAVEGFGEDNLLYSMATQHPGSITLHNHPNVLRDLVRVNGEHLDLGTVDILRDRERKIPRYNDFRAMLGKPRVERFSDLSDNTRWVEEMREVYDNRIDAVDSLVGMYAERPPAGFGFSDTAFRVFVLMASRRLKSDRFFTDDYRPEIYTPEGLRWIDDNSMATVICRHHPRLAPHLDGVENVFAPWPRR